MKSLISKFALIISTLMFITPGALAGLKIKEPGVSELQKVAVVGYRFFRDVEMEEASPFKLKREVIELTPEDPEYIMMQIADDRILEALQKGGSFSVVPHSEVFDSALYQSSTKDPAKKLALNWYYPEEFRVIKLKKANAIALCEALGVDAVIQLNFKHAVSGSSSTTLGVFGKEKSYVTLKGGITIIDKTGRTLISGSIKSDRKLKSKSRIFGNQDDGISIEANKEKAIPDEFFAGLLESYLEKLNKELGYE